jgi:hypothetical protein
MALISVLLVMMLMSALLVGFFAMIAADQQSSGVNRDQTQAYAAAHAGLEKLTADLGSLFTGGNYSPTTAQLGALEAAPPSLPGFQFIAPAGGPGYTITPQPTVAATITGNSPFQGLNGLLTPYEVNVTARATGGVLGGAAEVRMRRVVQTVAVPVFQFGMYSENDLSFFAGPDFDFGGRVHSNQNVYVAQDGSAALTLRDVVTAVGEVVRTHLANGVPISTSGHRGYVRVATTGGTNPAFKCLSCGAMGGNCQGSPPAATCTSATSTSAQEGSVTVASVPPSTLQTVGGVPTMVLVAGNTTNEPRWTNVSTGTFSNRIRNGRTGAKRLDLPLVSDGAVPVDLIRRPSLTAPDPQVVLDQRYFKMASLRILLSDRAADITGLQTVTPTAPVDLARLARDNAYRLALGVAWVNNIPLALAGPYVNSAGRGYRLPDGTPLADGYLKIERQDRAGVYTDVTVEILNRGFTGRNLGNGLDWNVRDPAPVAPFTAVARCATSVNDDPSPNAVIRLQRVRDNPVMVPAITSRTLGNANNAGVCGHAGQPGTAGGWPLTPPATNFIPLVLYDAREGARRDDEVNEGGSPHLAGVMHYVELDVANLRTWLATHADTMDVTGFVVYFSDRRGNKNLGADGAAGPRTGGTGTLYDADRFLSDDLETGELGFEDIVNPASATSVSNGTLDTGEDVNGNGVVDTYGGVPRQYPTAGTAFRLAGDPGWTPALGYQPTVLVPLGPSTDSLWAVGTPVTLTTPVPANEARVNPPIFFRRALKVVNGGYTAGTLRLPANGTQGLAVVAENPLYVQGNYNAPNAAGNDFGTTPGTDHVSASVIADAVTLLSNGFSDIGTFVSPHIVNDANRKGPTTWFRVAVVSGKGLNFPKPTSNAEDHTDFGTDGGAHNFLRYIEDWDGTLNYRGSIVSFYLNRQAVGIYKCCDVVYSPPTRGYRFDSDFLTPALLPPRTPMFRDVNTLTFRQLLRPNQQ